MRAFAPGKLVVSGAYSVLWGAEAIVVATDRGALADGERPAVHVSEEVALAVQRRLLPRACFVDVGALRRALPDGGSRKLGLGSSSAILLATLVALRGAPQDDAERRALFELALDLHRAAQGGGSGVDVAASTYGGVVGFRLADGASPVVRALALPAGLALHVFAAQTPAVTASLLRKVRSFATEAPARFDALIGAAREGAGRAVAAREPAAFVDALAQQRDALAELGALSAAPIVTSEVADLGVLAQAEGAFFGPSGAGGGDVAFFAGAAPPSPALTREAERLGYELLPCGVSARGASEAA